MQTRYTESFKIQAVEKVLHRSETTSIHEVANDLNISRSSLNKWLLQSRNNELETDNQLMNKKEKRPQDWTLEQKLNMVIACGALSEEETNAYCRQQGVYAHHVKQWKTSFAKGDASPDKAKSQAEIKGLKNSNKSLQKELNRKEKALAETAALLVLQKKVNIIWGNEEDNSQ